MKVKGLVNVLVVFAALLISMAAVGHGDVTPQPVNTEGLEPLGEEWLVENPYRGDERAIEIGSSAYNQNCARCHGLEVISGGLTPDLRKLNDDTEWNSTAEADEWYLMRIRNGAVIDGRVYMPPFEGLMNQEAMWAIKAYIESRPYED